MKTEKKIKIYVAMSGGVDSSVAAALLKQGWFLPAGRQVEVTGVYMKQWSPKVLSRVAGSRSAGGECIWKQERQDAMKVVGRLGIPFLTWDFSKEYEKEVGKYMVDSYKKGITPNPDVMCNKVIKFGLFFDKAMKSGADFIATGHYARTSLAKSNFFSAQTSPLGVSPRREKIYLARSHNIKLFKAKDKNKDQTYFLWAINKKVLEKTIFPVGGLEKPEVRELAKKFGLHVAEKKDSQGVCFIGPLNMKGFLKSYIKPKKGKIIFASSPSTGSGRSDEIGTHDGAYYYTIGQRHGMDIKNGKGPYFVVKKDIKKNILYVGSEKDLYSKKAKVKNINWLEKPEKFPVLVDVRTRYRAPLIKAELSKNGDLNFKKPERAVTPGQSAVFYQPNGKVLLGGGTIDKSL